MTDTFLTPLPPVDLNVDGRQTYVGTPEREAHIRDTMVAYKCSRLEAIEKINFESGEWSGDVVEIDELNGKETAFKSDPLLEI